MHLNSEETNEVQFTFSDVQYLDGYYIYGFGTNSVVHFHINECPGWKFGLWWDIPEEKDSKFLNGTVFAQFEETIDKFKPSKSIFNIDFTCDLDGHDFSNLWQVSKMIEFIRKEPYLAFCRDYCEWNYNSEYHTREEAKAVYYEYRQWRDTKIKYTKENDEKILLFVREKIVPHFPHSYISDSGPSVSPRYSLVAPYRYNKDLVDEPGFYGWFDPSIEEEKNLEQEWKAIVKDCDDISDQYHFYWSRPIYDSIYFYGVKLSDSIEDLDLSVPSFNCLARAGLKTVGDVVECDKRGDLIAIKGLGKKRLTEIRGRLFEFGAVD